MIRYSRKTVFYGITIILFITYLLYLQSDVQPETEIKNAKNKVNSNGKTPKNMVNSNGKTPKNSIQQSPYAYDPELKFKIELSEFHKIMSTDIQSLISKDSKIAEYIKVDYGQHHFDDFSQMADELRLLQKFWKINRQLVENAVENGNKTLHAQVKQFLLNELSTNNDVKKHLTSLQDFYYYMGRLEQKLTGWINPYHADLSSLYDSYLPDTKAIVIPIGNGFMSLGTTVIHAIREIHKCKIPIHVYYIGEDDLNLKNRQTLEKIADNVYTHDITKQLDNRIIDLGGWALKPFAALLAPAEHVMLIDADITFIQSPDVFFEHPEYIKNNALFFWDRSMWGNDDAHAKWALSFIMNDREFDTLYPSYDYSELNAEPKKFDSYIVPRRLQNSRYLKLDAAHEQESGVVLINKRQRFIPLLATCNMNNKQERDQITYKKVHGDKETFWMGFEMVGGQYAWNPSPPGMIFDATIEPLDNMPNLLTVGHDYKWQDTNKLCSTQMLHFDHESKPYWFNGGLYKNKIYKEWGLGEFTHYLHSNKPDWKLHPSNWVCLKSGDSTVQQMGEADIKIIKDTVKLFPV